jgi:hypothetical protein
MRIMYTPPSRNGRLIASDDLEGNA